MDTNETQGTEHTSVMRKFGHVADKAVQAMEPLADVIVPNAMAQYAGADDDRDLDRTVNLSRHSVEHVRGHKTFVDQHSERDEDLKGQFDNRVLELVGGVVQEREARENIRANKRNFNRMLTLFAALLIGLVITFVLTTPGMIPTSWKFLTPYTFVITILLDSGLALYGYIKKY